MAIVTANKDNRESRSVQQTFFLLKGGLDEARGLSRKAWELLANDLEMQDDSLQDGVGVAESEHLRVQWVCAGGGATLAIQSIDKAPPRCWELSIVQLPDDRIIISRQTPWSTGSGAGKAHPLDATIWGEITHGRDLVEFAPTKTPSFMAMVAAAVSPAGVISSNDSSQRILGLEHDLDYWRDLAKKQAKLLKDRPAAAAASALAEPPAEESPVREWKWSDIDEWAALNSDRIVIAPKALSEARKAIYEKPELAYQCLEMLAHEYRLVKLNELPRNAYKDRATLLGMEIGGSIQEWLGRSFGGQYYVSWGGRRLFLDQHLAKGVSRDPRFILRVYFTWDEIEEKVIVGWLPTHLDNTKS